jgi:hypothetical protein
MTFQFSARALLAAALLATCVSACGSASSSSTGAAAGGTAVASSTRYQARLELAKCFRAHGINVPDPTPGGGAAGGGGDGLFRVLRNYTQAQITAARQACSQYFAQAFPNANLTPAQQAQFRQEFVQWAQCMRSHGIDIPDPTTNGAGGFGLRRALSSIDRNSPAFKSASTACASLRPRFGRFGAGVGTGTSTGA